MEYYCHTSIGLVAIIPQPALPTAVELLINGKKHSAYISAEEAARAVASSSTGNKELDALPCWSVPALLSDWSQTIPHHFTTGTTASVDSKSAKQKKVLHMQTQPEMHSAY